MKKNVLFVDDEQNFRDAMRRMLRDQRGDWDLHFAEGADEALALALAQPLDVIVSDINMPGKSGFDLLQALRETTQTQDVPVIILTGNAQFDLKQRALDMGATDLLNKPVNKEELLARVRSALRLKSYQDEIKHQNAVLEDRVRERTHELEQSRLDIVWRLAKAGEYRDEETGNHVLRVALFSRILAEHLGAPQPYVELVFLTSPLHDIGKIGVPDAILLKPGRLDPEERRIIEQHTVIGASILEQAPKGMAAYYTWRGITTDQVMCPLENPVLKMGKSIVLTHHEKWTGGGYPYGIAGEDIPLEGRIVTIADIYDALRADRPYKQAFSEEKTLDIMAEEAKTRFDPAVYDAFLKSKADFEEIRNTYSG